MATFRRTRAPVPAFLAAAAAAALTVPAAHAAAQSPFPGDAEIRSILQQRIDQGRAVGLVVGLLEADGSTRVVYAGSAGPDARPLGERTLFEIGSVTKVFTGALLAEMERRGEVRASDPVARHLPDGVRVPSRNGREITLLDLATHRSALPRLPRNMTPANAANPYVDYTVDQLYAFLASYEPTQEIGAVTNYSNLGTGLLGHALARAAGASYEDALRTRILEPLGLRNTTITLAGEHQAWMAQGHTAAGDVTPLWDLPTLAGAGALRADVGDMLRWLAVNLDPPASGLGAALRNAQEPRAPLAAGAAGGPSIGLGWVVQPAGGSRLVWHNGGTGGFFSFAGFDPERRIGVVVLSNAQHSVDDIALHLLDRSNPLSDPPRGRTEVEVAPAILHDYVGEYELAPGMSLTITLHEGALFVQPTGQPRLPLFAESEDRFFLRAVDAQVTFQRDGDGSVAGLVLHQGGRDMPGRRLP